MYASDPGEAAIFAKRCCKSFYINNVLITSGAPSSVKEDYFLLSWGSLPPPFHLMRRSYGVLEKGVQKYLFSGVVTCSADYQ
jgi:hypothetical protein